MCSLLGPRGKAVDSPQICVSTHDRCQVQSYGATAAALTQPPFCSKKTADRSFWALNHGNPVARVVSRGTNINRQQHQHTHHTSAWRCRLTEPVKAVLLLECEILESRWFSLCWCGVEAFLWTLSSLDTMSNLHLKKGTAWRKGSF